ncbi:hypothetical protein KSS87_015180 [Heliosperma pusillum]|nr:hypothetical protein KSS87_015180 [Heliosperma pusillum]
MCSFGTLQAYSNKLTKKLSSPLIPSTNESASPLRYVLFAN